MSLAQAPRCCWQARGRAAAHVCGPSQAKERDTHCWQLGLLAARPAAGSPTGQPRLAYSSKCRAGHSPMRQVADGALHCPKQLVRLVLPARAPHPLRAGARTRLFAATAAAATAAPSTAASRATACCKAARRAAWVAVRAALLPAAAAAALPAPAQPAVAAPPSAPATACPGSLLRPSLPSHAAAWLPSAPALPPPSRAAALGCCCSCCRSSLSAALGCCWLPACHPRCFLLPSCRG